MKKLIKTLTIFFFTLFYGQILAQVPNLTWAKSMEGTSEDHGKAIIVDNNGNVYTTGYFSGTVDFDPGVGIANLSTIGSHDIFISKLDAFGNFLWAKSLGGGGQDWGRSIAVDGNGNVYTSGFFNATVDFDPGISIFNLTSAGGKDIFLCKLDAMGNFIWAGQMGGSTNDEANAITLDAFGNIHVTGYFTGVADFDPGTGTNNLTSAGNHDIFVNKIDSSGNLLWVKQMGGIGGGDWGNSIVVDSSGNIYTTGEFTNIADFDPGVGTSNLTTLGANDIFVNKLDSSGSFLWVKQMGGNGFDAGNSIVIDDNGNIYTTGHFSTTSDFNPGVGIFNLTATGVGTSDIFVSKLDALGKFLWAGKMGGTGDESGRSIAIDGSKNVYTTGVFGITTDFDPGAGTFNLSPAGGFNNEIFISKLDSTGAFLWAGQMGGTFHDEGNSIDIDGSDNIYLTGYFSIVANLDPGINTFNLTSAGGAEIFVAKLKFCFNTTATISPSACDSYTSPSGNYVWTNSNTYMDTISNIAGCDSIITINLTINVVDTSISFVSPTITANAVGATYQWLDCNNGNSFIVGETSQNYIATANGNYAVIITENSCTDTSACINMTVTGISNFSNDFNINVYPNPSNDLVNIIIGNPIPLVEVEVLDVSGKLINKTLLKNGNGVVDLSKEPYGLYLIKIIIGNQIITKKIIRE